MSFTRNLGKVIFVVTVSVAALRDFATDASNDELSLFIIAGMSVATASEYIWNRNK